MSTTYRILLIMPFRDSASDMLEKLLHNNKYEVIVISRINQAIERIIDNYPDLIVCHHGMNDSSGFNQYRLLQPVLSSKDIPFVLYLEEFSKEDILIGLELGIDSFIVKPFDEEAILKKVENLILKRKKAKAFDSGNFTYLFDNSPVAKFITKNVQIIKINKAFSDVTGIKMGSSFYPKIHDVFDFQENEENRISFSKLLNGLRNFCLLKSVRLKDNPSKNFNIHMVYQEDVNKHILVCELVPPCMNEDSEITFGNHSSNRSDNNTRLILTKREVEVLELSSRGFEIKQIANELGISSRTVEKHRSNIMEKTNSNNIIEAINYFTTQYISSQN